MKRVMWFVCVVLIAWGCSDNGLKNVESADSAAGDTGTRAANDTLTAEVITDMGYYCFTDYYVDAPGNIYGAYVRGIFDRVDLQGDFRTVGALPVSSEHPYWSVGPDYKPSYGFCVDPDNRIYCITSTNYLLKLTPEERSASPGEPGNYEDLTGKFPYGTVFLAVAAAQVDGDVFVATAQGDGSDNPWKSYEALSVYRITAGGEVTKVVDRIQVPVAPDPPYEYYYSGVKHTQKMFAYTSLLAKARGDMIYGLDAEGSYFRVGIVSGEATCYIPRVPVQHLAAGTGKDHPVALSGRQIVELRPDLSYDPVIGSLPSLIPEDAQVLLFLTNADATIYYVVVLEYRMWWKEPVLEPVLYRLKVNNHSLFAE